MALKIYSYQNDLSNENDYMFKSVFKQINITEQKVKLNEKPKTFKMEVNEKKSEIKKLVRQKQSNSQLSQILRGSRRKPTYLRCFETGLKKVFFGENGQITKELPKLHKELRYRKHRKILNLEQKINLGPLTYYNLKENTEHEERRINEVKKCALIRSDYFTVEIDKELDLNLNSINNKKNINSRNARNSKIILSNLNLNVNMSSGTGDYKPDNNKKINDSLNTMTHYNTIDTNENRITHNRSITNKTELSNRTKDVAKSIICKATVIQSTQENMEKRLFKIIDKAHLDKPISANLKKDIEVIMGMKIKKKMPGNKAKEHLIQAVIIQDDYSHMDKKKAEMLRISDGINKMTDQFALNLGKELSKTYWKSTKGDKYSKPLHMVKEELRQQTTLRNRINNNTFLMQKMKFNLQLKKNILYEQIESAKSE